MIYPKDGLERKNASKARSIVHYKLNADNWEYKEETGKDVGRDCIIELSENNEWRNHKIEGQIKGRSSINKLCNGDITFPFEVKTINYALSSSIPFVLFLADITKEIVYYLPIQKYFLENPQEYKKAKKEQGTINVHISPACTLPEDEDNLIKIATLTYNPNIFKEKKYQ